MYNGKNLIHKIESSWANDTKAIIVRGALLLLFVFLLDIYLIIPMPFPPITHTKEKFIVFTPIGKQHEYIHVIHVGGFTWQFC
jgi:hypothetical protein